MSDLLLLPMTLLALAGHTVLIVGVVNRSHAYGWNRNLVDVLTAVCGVALLAAPAWAAWVAWTGGGLDALRYSAPLAWYGVLCMLLALAAALHSLYLTLHKERRGVVLARAVSTHNFCQKHDLRELASPIPRAFCLLPGNQVLSLAVEEKRLAIPNLPEGLVGLKLAHLADLHMSGRFARVIFEEVVELTNQWAPDLVALTGDLVEKDECLDWIEPTYGRLRATHGVCYVLGNHDKKCSHQEVRRRLNDAGAVDVRHTPLVVDTPGGTIEVVGNELPWFSPAGEFTHQNALRLVLAHGPDQFGWAVERQANLVLAGHCHGGQVRLPLLGAVLTPSTSGTRYTCGAFRRAATVMHVTRGTGSLAPFRYCCPPELSLLTLDRA